MSSACICHLNEWCFYCEMYVPLERENSLLLEGLRKLPDKILQIDSFADIEELTFPLSEPTEEDQQEWFDEFCRRLRDHVTGCFEDLLAQYATPEPTCKTCHGVGDVTLTVMRQPDEYENVPCPDCQEEDTP